MQNIYDISDTQLLSVTIRSYISLPAARAEYKILFLLTKIMSQHNETMTKSSKLH